MARARLPSLPKPQVASASAAASRASTAAATRASLLTTLTVMSRRRTSKRAFFSKESALPTSFFLAPAAATLCRTTSRNIVSAVARASPRWRPKGTEGASLTRGSEATVSAVPSPATTGAPHSAPGARWAGSGLPLPFGAETPLPLPLAQQPALGAGGWCGRGEPWVWMAG
eukprot:scaffold49161_cov62-Phaeocystis_antarctica.AAC.1